MGPSAFAFAFVASIDSIRFFGPAMAPRMQARKRPSSTALPAAKVAKTRQDTTALVAELVTALKRSFHQNRNTKDATAMAGYVKGKFPFYGLKAPLRRQLAGEVLASWQARHQHDIDQDVARQLLEELYCCKERELHYVGAEVCSGLLRKGRVGFDFLPVVKHGVTKNSWWDTVDIFAASSMSPYLLACGGGSAPSSDLLQEMDQWAVSSNVWLRRTAILCQLKLKGLTDVRRLQRYILLNASDKDFFVRKAIGWALREYAKHDAKWVKQFLKQHKDRLSGLSVREASLHLSN